MYAFPPMVHNGRTCAPLAIGAIFRDTRRNDSRAAARYWLLYGVFMRLRLQKTASEAKRTKAHYTRTGLAQIAA
jgi:hypothetical protein